MLDFEIIETYDPNKLVVVDSTRGIAGNISILIEIPNRGTALEKTYTIGLVNTYYDTDLSTPEEEELPDGVYSFSLSTEEETLKKQYLKTSRLQEDVDKVYLRHLKKDEHDKIEPTLIDVEMYIESAKAHLRAGDTLKARYFYDRAKTKVDKLLSCK